MPKKCIDCLKTLDDSYFSKKRKRVDGSYQLGSYCKACQKIRVKKHYLANKKDYIARGKVSKEKHKLKLTKYVNDVKLKNPCSCGETHPACLQFHHIDPKTKKKAIGEMISRNVSIKTIKEEIKKCIVICANCHLKLHYDQNNKKNISNNLDDDSKSIQNLNNHSCTAGLKTRV